MTAPVVVLFPGASLMEITEERGGLRVRCPGCGAIWFYLAAQGQTRHETFTHEDDCPVHARIQEAIRRHKSATGVTERN